jgi:Low-density lipoprotein receptor domain class A
MVKTIAVINPMKLDVQATNQLVHRTCSLEFPFGCVSDQQYISEYFVCDYEKDCNDGSEKISCKSTKCKENEFTCANKRCISKKWVCNKENYCRKKSDEKDLRVSSVNLDQRLMEEQHRLDRIHCQLFEIKASKSEKRNLNLVSL